VYIFSNQQDSAILLANLLKDAMFVGDDGACQHHKQQD